MRALALVLIVATGCPYTPVHSECMRDLPDTLESIRARWPTAGAARDNPYAEDCVWYWSHKKVSVEGFGVTMVTLDSEPLSNRPWDIPDHEHAVGRLRAPSLLFFDQQGDDWREWPLIGVGYHFHFDPCFEPGMSCATGEFFIHEAGYHHAILGDGGMTLATDDMLKDESLTVDAAGCSHIDAEDMTRRYGTIRHGRSWVTHLWLPPTDDELPMFGITDPWERWRDDPKRVVVDSRAFYYQDRAACDCPLSDL